MSSTGEPKEIVRYEKLVCDKIPDKIRKKGGECETRTLSKEEMLPALIDKLIEEAYEVKHAKDELERRKEAVDVFTVLMAILAEDKCSWDDMQLELEKHFQTKGGFKNRVFLVWATKP